MQPQFQMQSGFSYANAAALPRQPFSATPKSEGVPSSFYSMKGGGLFGYHPDQQQMLLSAALMQQNMLSQQQKAQHSQASQLSTL